MSKLSDQRGFTLIELLIALTVFSFMLLIVSVGFINVVRIHNQALASNVAQDNARTAMDEIVRGVRNSRSVENWTTGDIAFICLASSSGLEYVYYLENKVLYKADGCATHISPRALTSAAVKVTDFEPRQDTVGLTLVQKSVSISLTVASNNGTTTTDAGGVVQCGPTNSERTFCAVVTLKSGAVAR